MNSIDWIQEIAAAKEKIKQLEEELLHAAGDREVAIRSQITAKETQLTELYKLSQTAGKNIFNH